MKFRTFSYLLAVVAFVAIIYSPSTIGASVGGFGSTSPYDTSQTGTSQFLSLLRSGGYHVVIANDTQQAILGSGSPRAVYFLIGADRPLTSSEVQTIQSRYEAGTLSLLIAEGNVTNRAMINTMFNADVTGAAILDPTSPFKDHRVFTVNLNLGAGVTGVIDVASPILLHSNALTPVAATSAFSFDAANQTLGPRDVVATGASVKGARALLITDSGPFANYLLNYTKLADEKAFVQAMVGWATQSAKNTTIILDNAHYAAPKVPKLQFGVSVGMLVAYGLEQQLSALNSAYGSFPSQAQSFLQTFHISITDALARVLVGLVLLLAVYGAIVKWFAADTKGNDDEPVPNTEKNIVAESKARLDFLQTSRDRSFYVATLAQLYEVLDSIFVREFGNGFSSANEKDLASRLGEGGAREARELFEQLRPIYEYATGGRRYLFPPVLRWKSRVSSLSRRSEKLLNELGMTITGAEEKNRVEYVLRGR